MTGWVASEPGERPPRPVEDVGIKVVAQEELDGEAEDETAPPAGIGPSVPGPGWQQSPPYRAEEMLATLPLPREAPAQYGIRGALKLQPGTSERSQRADRELAATLFPRPVTVVVANPKGGAGKTPATLLLAGAFGNARGGGVVAWDNNELRGSLHLRTDAHGNPSTVSNLLQAMPQLQRSDARLGDVASYLRRQVAGQYDALVSSATTYTQIKAADFKQVHTVLSRFYQMLVIDTGNNEGSSNWRAAMRHADVLVVPVKWKSAACAAAVHMLEELQEQGPAAQWLVQRTVIAVSNGPGDANRDLEQQLRPYFEARSAALIDIPTDPHIAEEGVLDHAALHPATRRAALRLAAKVAEQINLSMKGFHR